MKIRISTRTLLIFMTLTIIVLSSLCVSYKYGVNNETTANIMTTSVTIPEGYNYYSPSHILTKDCLKNKVSKQYVLECLENDDPDEITAMIIVPKYDSFKNPDFSITVIVTPFYCGKDYINMAWNEFDEEVKSLSKRKYQFSNYQVVENEYVRYVVFTPTNVSNTKVMTSIIKSRQIRIIAQYGNHIFTSSENKTFYEVAMSVEL